MVMISFDVRETWTINDIERSRKYIYKLKTAHHTRYIHSVHFKKKRREIYDIMDDEWGLGTVIKTQGMFCIRVEAYVSMRYSQRII